MRKQSLFAVLGACLVLLLTLPALNGAIFGDGFAWRCIPAWLCARGSAEALERYDKEAIERYTGNADGVYEALMELKGQGVRIRNARASFSRTQLADQGGMRLWVEDAPDGGAVFCLEAPVAGKRPPTPQQ